jgi:hypothetical protein
VRATFMGEEAKMDIPNLAHRRRHGQEGQSRCKLAMPKLAIYVGCHRPVRQHEATEREIAADRRRYPSGVSRGLLVIGSQGRLRNPDVKLPIGSSVSYTYAQFLS